ncbi:Voltage-gated ClC-type chloride channel ClcB [Enterobacter asburiae]|uniref:Voltage-gated ClC-type chloride channel ClcB n=1 Tax=Enterobacter asburiae TaxID=61645 RepID=A0A376F923_ENTAS|nr:Voltage-gated ClC-type chloride channel ClcB [Enterobacter asburiae]
MLRLHTYPDIRAMFRRLLIATVTGVLAALAVAVFRHSMYLLEWMILSNDSGSLVNAAASLSPWRRALTPALGGLAAGLLLWGWQRLNAQRPHAPTDYMEALETGDGQFDYGASLVKSLASLLVVASGSAIGREGAMILLAASPPPFSPGALRLNPNGNYGLPAVPPPGWPAPTMAPLAGSLFIAEILFGTLMLASLGPVVIAAVVALLTTQLLAPGAGTLYAVHLSGILTAADYALLVADGAGGGPLRTAADVADGLLPRAFPAPQAFAAVAVGAGRCDRRAAVSPHAEGVGGMATAWFRLFCSPRRCCPVIAGVLICKLLAVLASSGSGAPGGVFTPTLFVGMATGDAVCTAVRAVATGF